MANVVAVLLVLVTGVWLLRQAVQVDHALKRSGTKTQLRAFGSILERFKLDTGSYPAGPNGLSDLVVKPANASTNWHQYLDRVPPDPWGHPYLYVSHGQHNTNSYDLSSAGPDGIPGTPDDITNW